MALSSTKVASLFVFVLLAACDSKDNRSAVQNSYDKIEAELDADRDSAYNGNPYNYQMVYDSEKELLSLERRQRAEDTFVFILMPFMLPDMVDVESSGSFTNVKIAKYAYMNGQLLVARHFSRPIRIQESGMFNEYQWISPKPLNGQYFTLKDIPLDPNSLTVDISHDRVLLSYPIVSHASPTLVKPIASSEYYLLSRNARKFRDEVSNKILNARKEKKSIRLDYNDDEDLLVNIL